jgi:hypothetical protein
MRRTVKPAYPTASAKATWKRTAESPGGYLPARVRLRAAEKAENAQPVRRPKDVENRPPPACDSRFLPLKESDANANAAETLNSNEADQAVF